MWHDRTGRVKYSVIEKSRIHFYLSRLTRDIDIAILSVCHCKSITVDDFRGISISPAISKVFEYYILHRYRDFFKTSDNQFGIKQGSSCTHAIYSLSCVVDYYVNCGSMINICALDLIVESV